MPKRLTKFKGVITDADLSGPARGAFTLKRAVLSGSIHRGSALWKQIVAPEFQEWAEYLGAESFEQLPIAKRRLVKLLVADWLFVSTFEPSIEDSTSLKEARAAMNSLSRIIRDLAGQKEERKLNEITLHDYLEMKSGGK